MKRFIPLALALPVALAALILPPDALVKRFLPGQFALYHARLVNGLRLTKLFLLVDALLLGALPLVRAKWFREARPQLGREPFPVVMRSDIIAMVLLTGLALGLRAHHLSSGYLVDEIVISKSMAEQSLQRLLIRAEPYRLVPAVCAFVLYRLFGISEISGRFLSLITGVASVPLLYLLARRWASAPGAFAAAAFLALSTFHIWYSQLMTSYAPALFFILLSVATFEACLRDARPRPWLWWGLSSFLAILAHIQLALFVLLAQGLRVGWRAAGEREGRIRMWRFLAVVTYCCSLAATIFAPNFFIWTRIIQGLAGSSDAYYVAVEPRGTVPGQALLFVQWLCNQYSPWFLQLGVGLALVAGLVLLDRRHPGLALDLMMPTLILWALFASGVIRRITPRHSIFTLVPTSLFVGIALGAVVELAMRNRGRGWRAAASVSLAVGLIALVLAGAVVSLQRYYATERLPFKSAAAFLASRAREGDLILSKGYGYTEFHYYDPKVGRIVDYDSVGPLLEGRAPVWFVCYGTAFVGGMPAPLRERFLSRTTLVFAHYGLPEQYRDMVDGFVYLYFGRRGSGESGRGLP